MEFCGWDCWKAVRTSPRRATRPRTAPRRTYSAASARPMPLDAPVMKTFNGVLMPARAVSLHLLGADLRDEVIQHLDRARQAVRRGRTGFELALHGERRYAVDLVVFHQLLVALQRALRRERVVRIRELLRIHAVLREEFRLVFRRQQIVLVDVDLVEDLRRQFLREPECVERVVQLRMRNEVVTEGDRHALEYDVRTLLLDPCFKVRVELVAVRAAVPEEFGDLDLARGHFDRLRR